MSDKLKAFANGWVLLQLMQDMKDTAAKLQADAWMETHWPTFLSQLETIGWRVQHPVLGEGKHTAAWGTAFKAA